MRNQPKQAVYLSDKEIYAAGKTGYQRGWKNIPPYAIASLRDFAALTWRKGFTDTRDCNEDDGKYGQRLYQKFILQTDGTLELDKPVVA
jgi:hypothetical protein